MGISLASFFGNLAVTDALSAGAVAVFPVSNHNQPGPNYLRLEQAITSNLASVEEKGTEGTVPMLVMVNESESFVLGLQGDELIGGKQNRVLNISVLVPPKSVVDLPVSCVEQGRWHFRSRSFQAGEKAFPKLRGELHEQIAKYMRHTGSARADQQAVWRSVRDELVRAEAPSPTQAMRSAYERRKAQSAALQEKLPYAEGACGLVCAVGGRIAMVEIFDRPQTCASEWGRLVRSLAFETTASAEGEPVAKQEVEHFLAYARASHLDVFPSPGVGMIAHFAAAAISGSALLFDDAVIHCSLFAKGPWR